jgi:hypothetical protein
LTSSTPSFIDAISNNSLCIIIIDDIILSIITFFGRYGIVIYGLLLSSKKTDALQPKESVKYHRQIGFDFSLLTLTFARRLSVPHNKMGTTLLSQMIYDLQLNLLKAIEHKY